MYFWGKRYGPGPHEIGIAKESANDSDVEIMADEPLGDAAEPPEDDGIDYKPSRVVTPTGQRVCDLEAGVKHSILLVQQDTENGNS